MNALFHSCHLATPLPYPCMPLDKRNEYYNACTYDSEPWPFKITTNPNAFHDVLLHLGEMRMKNKQHLVAWYLLVCHIYKRGRGVLARLVFWLPEKNCRTPTVYCIGKKNMENFISPNSVLPRVFLYPVSC